MSCINTDRAADAINKTKSSSAAMYCFRKMKPRDEMMLKTDDRYENLQNDYTKERRQMEVLAMSIRKR